MLYTSPHFESEGFLNWEVAFWMMGRAQKFNCDKYMDKIELKRNAF